MKSIVPLTIISSVLLLSATPLEASKLSKWFNDHAVPRGPSANKINGAADQANVTAAEGQKAVKELAPKLNRLSDVLTWGIGVLLALLALLLIGKNVTIWRQALAKRQFQRIRQESDIP